MTYLRIDVQANSYRARTKTLWVPGDTIAFTD